MKNKHALFVVLNLLMTAICAQENSIEEDKAMNMISTSQTDEEMKRKNILDLIRLTSVQSEVIDFMLPSIVDHSITALGKNASCDEVVPLVKELITSEAYLSPFVAMYDELFTGDEIAKIVSFYKSDECKKIGKLAQKVCTPIVTSFHQAVRDILSGYPDSNKDSAIKDLILNVTKLNYLIEVTESEMPVVLDVYSIFCPPCKVVAPIFSDLSLSFEGKVKFAKMNIDEEFDISKELEIQSIPTFLFIKDGKIIDRHVGIITKEALTEKIDTLL